MTHRTESDAPSQPRADLCVRCPDCGWQGTFGQCPTAPHAGHACCRRCWAKGFEVCIEFVQPRAPEPSPGALRERLQRAIDILRNCSLVSSVRAEVATELNAVLAALDARVPDSGEAQRMYVVAEHVGADGKRSLHLSNTPDFDDQPVEMAVVIRATRA